MRRVPLLLLPYGFPALGAGLLLFLGDNVDGLLLPAMGVAAIGIALIVVWSRIAGLHAERGASRLAREGQVAWGCLPLRVVLAGAAAAIIAVGIAQAKSGQAYHRGIKRAIDAPTSAWLIGGSMILVGLGLAFAELLRTVQPDA